MTADQETKLIEQVQEVHTAVLGYKGQPQTGMLSRVENHEKRIGRLEGWRMYVLGGIAVIVLILEVAARTH